jgi:hypothetical protein
MFLLEENDLLMKPNLLDYLHWLLSLRGLQPFKQVRLIETTFYLQNTLV